MRGFRVSVVAALLVMTVLVYPIGAAGATTSESSAPPSGSRVVTLTCLGVGDLRVVLSADAPPAADTALPRGVSLLTAYRATNSRTSATLIGTQRGDISCGQVPVRGVRFGALSRGTAPAGVIGSDRFDGSVSISLLLPPPSLAAPSLTAQAVPGAGSPFPFAAVLHSYLATRSGRVSVAVFDATTGATYSYDPGSQYVTASIVKVAILGTLLRRAQDAHRSLTSAERSLATRMIEQSDNDAATALWNEVGRGPGVNTFMNRVGMPSTTPGTGGLWGLTTTNAPDQVRLVRTVAFSNAVLSNASRAYAESLMRAVTPSQRWGVTGGVPASATVALKNGWLSRTGGWAINSIGHVSGGTRDYVIAVLTSGNPTMSYGITTVENVSGMTWLRLPQSSGSGELQVLAVTSTGLWHTIRRSGGSWVPAGNAAVAAHITGTVESVTAASSVTGELQVLAVTSTGLWHTIRRSGGSWVPAGNAAVAAHITGTVESVTAASSVTGELQVLAVTSTGLWHTIRRSGGSWVPAGNAAVAAHITGTVKSVTAG